MDKARPWYRPIRHWWRDNPTAEVYTWIFSQPPATVIARLRENAELWDALCEEIGDNVREGCAVICDQGARNAASNGHSMVAGAAATLAATIRARGADETTK